MPSGTTAHHHQPTPTVSFYHEKGTKGVNNAMCSSPCPPQLHDARRALMGSGRRNNAAHPSYESLDAFFCGCLERVEAAYATLNKAFKIRVECWIAKLNGPYPLPNVAWRKNRNAFAALLARAVEEVDFREPFDRRPPEGSLPTLAPHLRARIPDRNPFRRTGSDFWLRHRAWLDTSRGLSARDFADEAAEASRTFQPTRRGWPSLTSQDPLFASPGLQGGGHDATADTTVIGGGIITSGIATTAGECCGATAAALSPPAPPPPPNPSSSRIHSGGGSGNNNAAPCAAAARGPCGTRTAKSKRCPCDPPGKAGFEGGAGGAPRGGGAGGGVEAAGERVLQTMVREQALQLAALRLQQAYRGRAQAAELQRVRHAYVRGTEGIARLQQHEERCRLTSVRLEEMLARRGEREEQNSQPEEQDASSSPRPPQLNPPLPELSKAKKGAAADLNVDLERRLDRFQEDARVLVGVAKQHHRQSSKS